MDLVMPSSGIQPDAVVLVTTVQGLRIQGQLEQRGAGYRRSEDFESSIDSLWCGRCRNSDQARPNLAHFADWGFGHLPVCMAKTKYSLSDDPKIPEAPIGWTLHIKELHALKIDVDAGAMVGVSYRRTIRK